jgi:transposase
VYWKVPMMEIHETVRRLRAGEGIRQVATDLGLGRNTVRRYRDRAIELGLLDLGRALGSVEDLAQLWGDAPHDGLVRPASLVETHRAYVEDQIRCGVQASVIHQRLQREGGFEGSYGSVLRFVQKLRPRADRGVTVRVETGPGEEAQVDFGFIGYLRATTEGPLRKTWAFVMTLSFSRHQYARLVQDQSAATWQECHRRAFEAFGGVPGVVVHDNLKAAIVRACNDDPAVQRSYRECAEHYGFRIRPARVRKPKDKGKVERGVQYLRNSFWKGRDFELLDPANQALGIWVGDIAGRRRHGTTNQVPLEVFEAAERGALRPLPEMPWEPVVYATAKVHPDSHIQFDRGFYSVPCRLIGKEVLVQAGLRQVLVFFEHAFVASHARVARPSQRRTCPDHIPPDKVSFYTKSPSWCRSQARSIGPATAEIIETLLDHRPLDRLRTCQGILALADKHGPARLEAACRRGLHFGDTSRRTLKTILDQALDFEPLPEGRQVQVLPHPRFARSAADLFGEDRPCS